jgi:crotonobetaine/carnitine-CoA ligase
VATAIDAFDDCRHGDRLFAPFEPSHLAGKIPVQLMAYWTGTHVFREGFKTTEFWRDVRANDCNRVWLFHAMANFVWRQPESADDASNPIESITGGPLLHEYLEFEQRFAVKMRTNFGMTEIGWPIATADDVRNHLSCGRPRPGYVLRIVDEHDLEVVAGEVGELLVRADAPWTMNVGYFGNPERTVEAWRNGWFHTGDAFRVDADGNWYFVDRMKDAIRRRSENISSFEVESMVGEHDAVLECAAIGVPSDDGEEEIKVCVVVKPDRSLDPPELIEFMRPRAPSFMLPRYIEVVDALPKTPTGKVRKMELKANWKRQATWDRLR